MNLNSNFTQTQTGLAYAATPREKRRGKKRMYMWIGRGQRKARTIPASSGEQMKDAARRGEGRLFVMFAYTADHAREMIQRGEVAPYGVAPPKVKVMPRAEVLQRLRSIREFYEFEVLPNRIGREFTRSLEAEARRQAYNALGLKAAPSPELVKQLKPDIDEFIENLKKTHKFIEFAHEEGGEWLTSFQERQQKYLAKQRPTPKEAPPPVSREPVQMRLFGLSQAQRELPLRMRAPEATDPIPEPLQSLALFARMYDPKRIDPWMVVNTLRERYREMHGTIPLPQSVKGKYPKPLEHILADYYGYASGDPERSIQAFWYHAHGYAPNGGPVPEVMLYPSLGFFGLGLAPASVWQTTFKEFTARTPKGDYPALPSELNWILQRTKVNPEGSLRVFRGRLPGHMKRKLEEWLSLRYRDPDQWLEDKRIKIDFRDGRTTDVYTIRHPFYFVAVTFYDKSGTVQVTEDRANYHAEAVREAIAQGKSVPLAVLNEYAPYMKEAEEAMYSSKSIPEQMRFFGLGNNGLSGKFFHCLTWQVNPYTGDLRCLNLATACQAKEACVTVEPRGRLRVCVTPKTVYSKHYKKKIQRCAAYRPICGPGCISEAAPQPARIIEPKEEEVRAVAEWMAEAEEEVLPGYDPKLLAHEILSRGGLRAYKKQYAGQKTDEEYMELPLFLKRKSGLPPDEMASEMGMDGDSELYAAIHAAYPPKTAVTPLQKKLQRRKATWTEVVSQYENRAYQYLITQQRREKGLEGRR